MSEREGGGLMELIATSHRAGFREAIEAAAKVAKEVYQTTSGMGAQRACLRIIDGVEALSPSKQALSGEGK